MDFFAWFEILARVLGCFGHLALALSYAGVLGPWATAAASMALAVAEALGLLGGP